MQLKAMYSYSHPYTF